VDVLGVGDGLNALEKEGAEDATEGINAFLEKREQDWKER